MAYNNKDSFGEKGMYPKYGLLKASLDPFILMIKTEVAEREIVTQYKLYYQTLVIQNL